MRTLSEFATTWRNQREVHYDWLVESVPLEIYWSLRTTNAGGKPWEHRLLSISEIDTSVPPGGGLASVNTVTITVAESTLGRSLRGIWNDVGRLEGQPITVWLLPEGEFYHNRIPYFTGKIDHVEWRTGVESGAGVGVLTAASEDLHRDTMLPATLLVQDALPNLPDQWRGAVLPLIYGSSAYLLVAPLIMVDSTTLTYRAADHPLRSMGLFHSVSTAEGTHIIPTSANTVTDPMNATLILLAPVTENRYDVGAYTRTLTHLVNVENPAFVLDGDVATAALLDSNTLNEDGDGHGRLAVKYVWENPSGGNTALVTLKEHRRNLNGATTLHAETILRVIDAATNLVRRDNVFRDGPYRHGLQPRTRQFTVPQLAIPPQEALEIEFTVVNEGGIGTPTEFWIIAELTLEYFFQADNLFYPFSCIIPLKAVRTRMGVSPARQATRLRKRPVSSSRCSRPCWASECILPPSSSRVRSS